MNMMLVANEIGLGSVWVGAFHEFELIEILEIPGHLRPVAIIPIGYPKRTAEPTSRKSKEEIVEWVR